MGQHHSIPGSLLCSLLHIQISSGWVWKSKVLTKDRLIQNNILMEQDTFEQCCLVVEKYSNLIPVTFVLGFYVRYLWSERLLLFILCPLPQYCDWPVVGPVLVDTLA